MSISNFRHTNSHLPPIDLHLIFEKLDELDFLSISNLDFAGYTGSKSQVQNRQKIKFIQLDFSNLIFEKSSALFNSSLILNNRFLRESGMASTPKIKYHVFLCIFQTNLAMATLGLK